MFSAPLALETGEIVTRDRFVYADFQCACENLQAR
jgi:hypothetical protein